jgi:uncharacterized membrane protein YgdD (TMEM256/DUF423 family)
MNHAKLFLLFAAASGALSVLLGAFGAHALKTRLPPEQLAVFETAVRYQMIHALALLAAAWLFGGTPQAAFLAAGYCYLLGTFFFSGSLYLLSCRSWWGFESWRWLGPITPLGGLLLIAGWVLMFIGVWRSR